jgi:hypothetical protein
LVANPVFLRAKVLSSSMGGCQETDHFHCGYFETQRLSLVGPKFYLATQSAITSKTKTPYVTAFWFAIDLEGLVDPLLVLVLPLEGETYGQPLLFAVIENELSALRLPRSESAGIPPFAIVKLKLPEAMGPVFMIVSEEVPPEQVVIVNVYAKAQLPIEIFEMLEFQV